MSANDFRAFNSLINPNDDAIYIALSRSASGKGVPITLSSAMTVLVTDIIAEIGVFLPQDISCIEITDEYLINKIISKKPGIIVTKIEDRFFIFSKEVGIKSSTCNTLVCGSPATTYGYAKSSKAILLPFKPVTNKAPRLDNAECVYMPDKLGVLPELLKPLYKISRAVPDSNITYPINTDLGNVLIKVYQNMSKIGYGGAGKRKVIAEINNELSAVPFTDDELEQLLQTNLLNTEISEFYNNKDQFLHNKMGDYLIRELSIKRDDSSKRLYFYDDIKKIYRSDDDILFGMMTQLCPAIKEYQRVEVLKYLEAVLARAGTLFNTEPMTIVFKNGILNAETLEFKEGTDANLETIQINCEYNANAVSPVADEFFNTATCGDSDIEKLLYEAIGYSLLKTSELQKAFLLIGNGKNGKSTYFDIIKEVLGRQNITTISFKDLANQFRASALDGKLASLAGDISAQPIQESDLFKSITTGEDILIERKFEHAYEKALFCTMFFSANSLPRTPDTSDGFFRRFCIIPFNADLKNIQEVDGLIFKNKLLSKESIEYIAYKAVMSIHKILTTTMHFTSSKEVDDMMTKYKISNSSVLTWFCDELDNNYKTLCDNRTNTSSFYNAYKNWCIDNGFKQCKSSNFVEQIKQYCNLSVNVYNRFTEKTKTLFDFMPEEIEVEQDKLPFDTDDESETSNETLDNIEE